MVAIATRELALDVYVRTMLLALAAVDMPVESIQVALAVLALQEPTPMRIAEATGRNVGEVHRVLKDLVERRVLREVHDGFAM